MIKEYINLKTNRKSVQFCFVRRIQEENLIFTNFRLRLYKEKFQHRSPVPKKL